jgi:hypothetical protein
MNELEGTSDTHISLHFEITKRVSVGPNATRRSEFQACSDKPEGEGTTLPLINPES